MYVYPSIYIHKCTHILITLFTGKKDGSGQRKGTCGEHFVLCSVYLMPVMPFIIVVNKYLSLAAKKAILLVREKKIKNQVYYAVFSTQFATYLFRGFFSVILRLLICAYQNTTVRIEA